MRIMVFTLAMLSYLVHTGTAKESPMQWVVFEDEKDRIVDGRIASPRTLDNRYLLPEYSELATWQEYARDLRLHVLVSAGLYPLPEKCPLNARISGRIEQEGYSVEKVYFESLPGFYVTGNLYRPLGKTGPFPGILCPHGHWQKGRLEDQPKGSIPGRCITLARMGCVVFSYDMVGYNDSLQISHGFGGDREQVWGLSVMGLQLWNSFRSVDFLESIPEVDTARLGCTGASGGGTQTFLLTAIDDRIKASAPVNMISAHFQGGCLCENGPLLRRDTFNVAIGALMAPRPLLMVSCTGDWTSDTLQVEYPAIQSIYRLFDAESQVSALQMKADHNYNQESREAVYAFFGQTFLGMPKGSSFPEPPFTVEPDEALRVFPEGRLPEGSPNAETITAHFIEKAQQQMKSLFPRSPDGLASFREKMGPAMAHALGAQYPESSVAAQEKGSFESGSLQVQRMVLGRQGTTETIPCLRVTASRAPSPSQWILMVHGEGKKGFLNEDGTGLSRLPSELIQKGCGLLLMDLFMQGEAEAPLAQVDAWKSVKYFSTYNPTTACNRIQDILTGLAFLKQSNPEAGIGIVASDAAGLWVLAARSLFPFSVSCVVDACGANPQEDPVFLDHLFVPCFRRLGDLQTCEALAFPAPLLLHNVQDPSLWASLSTLYEVAGQRESLKIEKAPCKTQDILGHLEL